MKSILSQYAQSHQGILIAMHTALREPVHAEQRELYIEAEALWEQLYTKDDPTWTRRGITRACGELDKKGLVYRAKEDEPGPWSYRLTRAGRDVAKALLEAHAIADLEAEDPAPGIGVPDNIDAATLLHRQVQSDEQALRAERAFDTFKRTLTEQLKVSIAAQPERYAYSVDAAPAVAARLADAVRNGTGNLDGTAVRSTCKLLGLERKRSTLMQYLTGGR